MASAPQGSREKGIRKEGGRQCKKKAKKSRGGGQTLNGFNRRAGVRNRRLTRNSTYHFAPSCHPTGKSGKGSVLSPVAGNRPLRPPYSTISTESPVRLQNDGSFANRENVGKCEQSFSATLGLGGRILCMGEDGMVVLETGSAANPARFRWLGYRNSQLGKQGLPRAPACPACVCFEFGDGRLGQVRRGADVTFGTAGRRGTHTAFALEADIPALLREGALGALGGQSGCACDVLTFWNQ